MTNTIADYVEVELASTFTPASDTTVDLVVKNDIYGLIDQKLTSIFQTFRLSIFEKTDVSQRITVAISAVVANGTLGGKNRYTATIATSDGSNPMIGLANTDDGTDADANIIAGNVSSLTITEFSTGSTAMIKVGAAEYNELRDAFDSNVASRFIQALCFDAGTDVSVGDARYPITVPTSYDGNTLTVANARVLTAGTTGDTTIQIHNVTDGVDMLSTPITIASGDTTGVGVVNALNAVVASGDYLRIDVDSVSTTAPKGLLVNIEFTQ